MRGYVQFGIYTFEMLEITEDKMDALIEKGYDLWDWPYRFSPKTKRVWPAPKWNCEFFYVGEPDDGADR